MLDNVAKLPVKPICLTAGLKLHGNPASLGLLHEKAGGFELIVLLIRTVVGLLY
jgi:hypothetical protein